MTTIVKRLLAVDKEQELLQSFIFKSVGGSENTSHDCSNRQKTTPKNALHPTKRSKIKRPISEGKKLAKTVGNEGKGANAGSSITTSRMETDILANSRRNDESAQSMKRRKPKEFFVDFYTDKDRAAAVSAGAYDIKQSLQIKQKQDRSGVPLMADEVDIGSIIALGLKEIKNRNPENAIHFFTKALELNETDINALIARSKCYLLLGDTAKALKDAESALSCEKDNIRAIQQKAKALYFLGQFEQSLMYFHRGLKIRPELDIFRLGIQTTRKAIENTIGPNNMAPQQFSVVAAPKPNIEHPKDSEVAAKSNNSPKIPARVHKESVGKLLGKLAVDKEYFEKLLKHPHLMKANSKTETISEHVRKAVEYLKQRQEFWRQQRPCTALKKLSSATQSSTANIFTEWC